MGNLKHLLPLQRSHRSAPTEWISYKKKKRLLIFFVYVKLLKEIRKYNASLDFFQYIKAVKSESGGSVPLPDDGSVDVIYGDCDCDRLVFNHINNIRFVDNHRSLLKVGTWI